MRSQTLTHKHTQLYFLKHFGSAAAAVSVLLNRVYRLCFKEFMVSLQRRPLVASTPNSGSSYTQN